MTNFPGTLPVPARGFRYRYKPNAIFSYTHAHTYTRRKTHETLFGVATRNGSPISFSSFVPNHVKANGFSAQTFHWLGHHSVHDEP